MIQFYNIVTDSSLVTFSDEQIPNSKFQNPVNDFSKPCQNMIWYCTLQIFTLGLLCYKQQVKVKFTRKAL